MSKWTVMRLPSPLDHLTTQFGPGTTSVTSVNTMSPIFTRDDWWAYEPTSTYLYSTTSTSTSSIGMTPLMIPHIGNSASITFFANGVPYVIAQDHANFETVRDLLASGSDDVDLAVRLADITVAVKDATGGRGELTEDGLKIDGELMPACWSKIAIEKPEDVRVLVVSVGDTIRVEGDEEAPDGLYTVGDVDNDDTTKRVMVESDEGFFGFVANTSIKEIVNEAGGLP